MTQDKRLGLVLSINLVMVAGLVLVGIVASSLGVLATGVDYLGDALGTGLSLAALKLSRREHAHPKLTTYAALVNASLLLTVTLAIAADAISRLQTGTPAVDGVPVVIVSVIAAGAMIVCALILGNVEGDLSMQSVMLDSVADAAAALGVAGSGTIILVSHGVYWLDPVVAIAIAVVVAYHAIKLIRRVQISLSQTGTSSKGEPMSRRS